MPKFRIVCKIYKNELFLFNAHISEYEFGGEQNHEPQCLESYCSN